MPTFTPPVADGVAFGNSGADSDKLMRFYGAMPTGVTVWQDQNLVWHEQQYPYQGGDVVTSHNGTETITMPAVEGLATARRVYAGGHVHEIDDVQAVELAAAGYLDRINIADVSMTWKNEELAKLVRSRVSFVDSQEVPVLTIDGGEQGDATIAAGAVGSSGGQRDWFIHRDILYSNFEVNTGLNNVDYGVDGRLQQTGIVLRYVEDIPNNRKYGVTVNNNVFFFVPVINVGVWSATLDGSSMTNRQYGFPLDSTFTPLFPFKLDIRLDDNICRVRTYQADTQVPPWADDLTSYVHSKAIDLDVDAGLPGEIAATPTPTGRGGAGFVVAHMGTSAHSKFPRTYFKNRDNQ